MSRSTTKASSAASRSPPASATARSPTVSQTQHGLQRLRSRLAATRHQLPSVRWIDQRRSIEKSGLFVNFGAGQEDGRTYRADRAVGGAGRRRRPDLLVDAGRYREEVHEHGKTTIYGEYYDYDGGGNSRRTIAATAIHSIPTRCRHLAQIWDTGVQVYGAGIAQGIDKAALVLYLSYRHVEGDLTLRRLVPAASPTAPSRRADR